MVDCFIDSRIYFHYIIKDGEENEEIAFPETLEPMEEAEDELTAMIPETQLK